MNKSSVKLLYILSVIQIINTHTVILGSSSSKSLPIVTRFSKNSLPASFLAEAQQAKMSILKPTEADRAVLYQNYPDGAVLFPQNTDIALKFNAMIAAIKANPDLIEFFRKMHINSLNNLYAYLMKIYTNFNLTNPGCLQDTETPTANLSVYLADDAMYATNKKKLILNHFINLIQAQFAASIMSYVPSTSPDMAVSLGKLFVENDCGIDLKQFTVKQTDSAILASQAKYLDFLQLYISFFQLYTSYLDQLDSFGVSKYYTIASTCLKASSDSVTGLSKLNPSMFFYDVESMRSIQFIPFVASSIPTKSQLIPWAPTIVNAAVKNLTMNGHPIAYFKDSAGKKTSNQAQAQSLFLLVETGPSLFEEELLAQPAWLNTQDGSLRILRACLGDFSALVGLGILDSAVENIIQQVVSKNTRNASVLPQIKKS